jgi:hypothetical protein
LRAAEANVRRIKRAAMPSFIPFMMDVAAGPWKWQNRPSTQLSCHGSRAAVLELSRGD